MNSNLLNTTAVKGTFKTLSKVIQGSYKTEGAGFKVCRVIGAEGIRNLDPFLMLDYINNEKVSAGAPDHPHRGFETVSYVRKGKVMHEDFLGNEGVISEGGIQWMTAGRGILHSEMPVKDSGGFEGFQLWVNLPNEKKTMEPKYQDADSSQIPIYEEKDLWSKIVAGEFAGKVGPCKSNAGNISFFDFKLSNGKQLDIDVRDNTNGMVFCYGGEITIGNSKVSKGNAGVFFKKDAGNRLLITENNGAEANFLVFFGEPIGEPIVQYGPFVMCSQTDIEKAFSDYRFGRNGFENAPTWKSKYGGF